MSDRTHEGKTVVTRIILVATSDPHTRLRKGDQGTLLRRYTDPWGDECVSVEWDDGSCLSLIRGEDKWLESDWNADDPTDYLGIYSSRTED
jgi:hypothetical protein